MAAPNRGGGAVQLRGAAPQKQARYGSAAKHAKSRSHGGTLPISVAKKSTKLRISGCSYLDL